MDIASFAKNAIRWQQQIEKAVISLEHLPTRCPIASETESFGFEIRQLLHGNYRILFTIKENSVHVLHVRHAARSNLEPGSIAESEGGNGNG